jgi:hypothetical protein
LYETLHFRHVWALFGLIAALAIAAGNRAEQARIGIEPGGGALP